jgi:flagellar biosynthetic protein FliQ
MDADYFLTLANQTMWVLALAGAPILIPALVAGLLIGMIQAATQINEQTLSFIPKLIAMALVMIITGPWMLRTLVTFTRGLIESLPQAVR